MVIDPNGFVIAIAVIGGMAYGIGFVFGHARGYRDGRLSK